MSSYYYDSAINSYHAQNGGFVSSGSHSQNSGIRVQYRQPEQEPEYSPHNLGVVFIPLQPLPQPVFYQNTVIQSNSPMRPTIIMRQQYGGPNVPNVPWW